jgi:hypothetical protein
MTIIVDFRHGRSAAACLCSLADCDPEPPLSRAGTASHDGAEIILFPTLSRKRLSRPRKALKRRRAREHGSRE